MSNPTPPQDPSEQPPSGDAATPPVPPSPDHQPTQAYPPAYGSDQPTQAYPPGYGADQQPTQAYPPAPQHPVPPAYGQPAAGYPQQTSAAPGQPVYGAPAQPAQPDTRPKTFGWVALGLAIAGIVLVGVAFLPLLWVSLTLAVIGGILLLAALIMGIVVLANKKQGGKPLGIIAIIVSVLGGFAWIGALTWSLLLIGLASAGSGSAEVTDPTPPAVVETEDPGSGGSTDEEGDVDVVAGGEAAYLAEVRPALFELFQEVGPITEDEMELVFPDTLLVSLGETILILGEDGRQSMIDSLAQSAGDSFSAQQAERFYEIISSAALTHLAE
ncbi:hypothetical protein ACFQZV_04355 [Microbacterium koreense]|uniref:DUF4190 domain-containing protein n=1 Tax=Microbacterium koreense TaxID=323761 RepID=A0ABW2ZPZ9_9MICO